MSIQRNQHAIVEPLLGTYEFDGIEWDCYGTIHAEGPELAQIALKGTTTDLFDLLNVNHINSMTAVLEREWLNAKVHAAPANMPFCFALQAH